MKTLKECWDGIENEIKQDQEYAYALFCNIVMPFRDAGASRELAQEGASRVMELLYKIDMRKHKYFKT